MREPQSGKSALFRAQRVRTFTVQWDDLTEMKHRSLAPHKQHVQYQKMTCEMLYSARAQDGPQEMERN